LIAGRRGRTIAAVGERPAGITIDDVRAFAATLPRTTEGVVRGCLKFRVGRIVYVAFSADETVMGFAFPREWRNALVESEPEKFMLPSRGDLRYNWVSARMDAIDVAEMRELVLDAWAMVVPKRVADEYLAR
jgi:hypothetical protein